MKPPSPLFFLPTHVFFLPLPRQRAFRVNFLPWFLSRIGRFFWEGIKKGPLIPTYFSFFRMEIIVFFRVGLLPWFKGGGGVCCFS